MGPKRFEYAVSLAKDGSMLADGGAATSPPAVWTPEHLLLAALSR